MSKTLLFPIRPLQTEPPKLTQSFIPICGGHLLSLLVVRRADCDPKLSEITNPRT